MIDTHASVKTPTGYLPGLPEWVLHEIMPDTIILVETDNDQILMRRMTDETRSRDKEGAVRLPSTSSSTGLSLPAYAMVTGGTIRIITNADHLLDLAAKEMADVLR